MGRPKLSFRHSFVVSLAAGAAWEELGARGKQELERAGACQCRAVREECIDVGWAKESPTSNMRQ